MYRLLGTYESLNGSPEVDISHNLYNEIGQKASESLHSVNADTTFAQTQEFRYSIRSELTNINNGTLTNDGVTQSDPNALFGESITYSETSPISAAPQYTGNISGITWRNKIEKTGLPGLTTGGQGYTFTYDNVNRMTGNNYYKQSGTGFAEDTTGALTENILGYDEMGNIDTLQREDKNSNLINNLTYTYPSLSNQLQSISDAGTQNISGTFTYDGNGNMTSDSRKGITITYNFLGLPDTVKQGASELVFTYDAMGNKLYKQLITSGTVVSQRHYIEDAQVTATSSITYDGKVESIATAEGRILSPDSSSYKYEYYLQDHLYTNRVSFRPNADGTLNLGLVQNYYPFGVDIGDSTMNYSASPSNFYQYEGKELQPELNLNTFDFGARHYDAVLGRWGVVDLLADRSAEFSPYSYVEDNPLNLTDPDGLQTHPQITTIPNLPNALEDGSSGFLTATNPATPSQSLLNGIGPVVNTVSLVAGAVSGVVGAANATALHQVKDQTLNSFNKAQGNVNNVNTSQNYAINGSGGSASQGGCPTCVIPSTVGHNILGDNYTGGNNPMNYNGTYNYSMPLMSQTDGPSLGHDRRYDRVGVAGAGAVFSDTRTSLIDLRFVAEQYDIAFNPANTAMPTRDPMGAISAFKSFVAGTGILFYSLPKMINQSITNPAGWGSSLMWYQASNIGVNNVPNK